MSACQYKMYTNVCIARESNPFIASMASALRGVASGAHLWQLLQEVAAPAASWKTSTAIIPSLECGHLR